MSADGPVENRSPRPSGLAAGTVIGALVSYAALLLAFWTTAELLGLRTSLEHFPSAFASFALLFAPYWFFGFGMAEQLRNRLGSRWGRMLLPGLLVIPYLLFAWPRRELRFGYAALFAFLPVALTALELRASTRAVDASSDQETHSEKGITWRDAVVLLAVGIPVEFGSLQPAWPNTGLSVLPKLLLMDAALYAFLVARGLPNSGYDFRPHWRDLAVGLREWLFYAPIAIALGTTLHFIRFRAYAPSVTKVAATWLVLFFLVAVPEEFFFRGLLQNLLEKRLVAHTEAKAGRSSQTRTGETSPRVAALLIASVIFGLSHFNKPMPFNWRYVILATIAGVFYGRAWRARRRLLCSALTHTTVDVVWTVWFR